MRRHPWVATCASLAMAVTMTGTLAAAPASASTTPQDRNRAAVQRGDDQRRGDQRRDQDHRRFDDRDRQAVHDWYGQNRGRLPMGFRDRDRLPNRYDGQLREGYVIDRNLRRDVHAIPIALLRLLTPPPRGFRYVVLDSNIVLIDNGYRVYDVMPIGRW